MKVKIFTEGGNDIGFGHISRCTALYDEIINRKIDANLIIYGDINDFTLLNNRIVINNNWLNRDYLLKNVTNEDYCIVDSYLTSKELLNIISENAKKTLYIDDINRINYPKGIIVNPSLDIGTIKYSTNDNVKVYYGLDYIILRKPFVNITRNKFNIKPNNVLITMGGSDIRNLTPLIIKKICSLHSELHFNIVIGNGFTNLTEIDKALKKVGSNIKLYYNVDARQMKELMLKSDFAITAAGQTVYELLATQTPFIPIKVIDNQNNNISSLIKFELVSEIIDYSDNFMLEKLIYNFNKYIDAQVRKNLINKFKKLEIGKGPKKIIDRLLKDL